MVDPLSNCNLETGKCSVDLVDDDYDDVSDYPDEEQHVTPSILLCPELLSVDSIAVVRSDEEFTPYYLVKVTKPPHTLTTTVTDQYQYRFEAGCTVIVGHYFELVPKQDFIYYIDGKEVILNVLCLLPTVCPPLESKGKREVHGSLKDIYKISLTAHEELLSFLV